MPDVEKEAEMLVHNARHDSVTVKRLTQTRGKLFNFLSGPPLISYLEEDEQPHFIFTKGGAETAVVTFINHEGQYGTSPVDYYLFTVLTNRRLLLVYGMDGGDNVTSCRFNDLHSAHFSSQGAMERLMRFSNNEGEYLVEVKETKSDIRAAGDYLQEVGVPEVNPTSYLNVLATRAEGQTVTADRLLGLEKYFENVMRYLEPSEQPQFLFPLTTGSAALVVESGAERDELLKTTEGGTAVVTDRSVRIVGSTGDWSIPYGSISSVDHVGNPSLHIQTSGRTYYINLAKHHFDLGAEAQQAARYIRNRQRKHVNSGGSSNTSGPVDSSDPMARLQQLGELRKEGILTDAEFEEKKAELLDEI